MRLAYAGIKGALLVGTIPSQEIKKTQNMGGIATGIRNDENQFCLKVEEGEENDEYLITRHGQFLKPINICNVYGEQEGRNKTMKLKNDGLRSIITLK